jgi:antitoxin (DNA-binding transcriptional repressor) of toxin-antitoxin stability system
MNPQHSHESVPGELAIDALPTLEAEAVRSAAHLAAAGVPVRVTEGGKTIAMIVARTSEQQDAPQS